MKKFLGLLAAVSSCFSLFALPVGNPAEPDMLSTGLFTRDRGDCAGMRFGYRGDFVANKYLKFNESEDHVDFYTTGTNAITATLNLWNRLDLFGLIGETDVHFDTSTSFGGLLGEVIVQSDRQLSYGWGAKWIIWNCGSTALSIEGQYQNFRANLRQATLLVPALDEPVIIITETHAFRVTYHEYQFSLGISHRIGHLVPYVAVKYSNEIAELRDHTKITNFNVKMKNRRKFGLAIGISLFEACGIEITAEGRFINEEALSIIGQFRF